MIEKKRLDILVLEKGLAKSRSEARALIMSGLVYVNGTREDKAGSLFAVNDRTLIQLKTTGHRYVSRGGQKLEKAVKEFGLDLKGCYCMDVGASTGGFTDCMLKNGASKVYAVDVGYGQLDWKLRQDPRVVSLEKTNIRYIEAGSIGDERLDFAAVDVSFISLKYVLPPLKKLLKGDARAVCLIKPQFEAGRSEVGKRGVVKDPAIHKKVSFEIARMTLDLGFGILGFTYSPIRGPQGNIEYLLYISNDPEASGCIKPEQDFIDKVVDEAHKLLE